MLTISEKVVVRVHDLVTWLSPTLEWSWGREVSYPPTPTSSPESSPLRYEIPQPQVLTDPGIDFSDVEKQQKEYESNHNTRRTEYGAQTKVVVLSYPRYCRYRALLRRLEGAEPSWLCSSIAAALGGFTATPGTRVLFCRDTFDYPDLETHELLCNHLGKYGYRSSHFAWGGMGEACNACWWKRLLPVRLFSCGIKGLFKCAAIVWNTESGSVRWLRTEI